MTCQVQAQLNFLTGKVSATDKFLFLVLVNIATLAQAKIQTRFTINRKIGL